MPSVKLEIRIISARGLKDTDFISKSDPYAVLKVEGEKKKTGTGSGANPVWNETLTFSISDSTTEILMKIYDKDIGRDDFLGEAVIPLDGAFMQGKFPAIPYNVLKGGKFCGEVRVGLNFYSQRQGGGRSHHDDDDDY